MTIINGANGGVPRAPDDMLVKQQRQVGQKELSKDDFMKIFLKQIRMQDPNKPFDSASMLQQMAQLTQLSASEELKKTIGSLNLSIAKSQVMSASQLIGKKVQLGAKVAPLVKGEGLSGSVILTGASKEVTITIKDKDGKVVKTITKSAATGGVLDFDWDGKDDAGNEMKEGFYNISAEANYTGKKVAAATAGTFKVGSVAMDPTNGTVILNVDGLGGIGMENIIKIL